MHIIHRLESRMNELNAKTNGKIQKAIDWCTRNRNMLFLAVCLANHGIYTIVFHYLDIWQLSTLNLVSCGFYLDFLLIRRDMSEKSIVYTYFEILLFSVLSEIFLGPDYGFFLYIVGMSATVFYLVPSYGNRRFLFQFIGIVTTIVLEGAILAFDISFPSIQNVTEPYQIPIYLGNLGVTAAIVFGATFFYSQETEKVWESLRYSTNHDALTGLYNRRSLYKMYDEIKDNGNFCVVMGDIDNFKKINDTYGHGCGDDVLKGVSSIMNEMADKNDIACRWGGEEFLLVIAGSKESCLAKLNEIRNKILDLEFTQGDKKVTVTMTFGFVNCLEILEHTELIDPSMNIDALVQIADTRLYYGKENGKNVIIDKNVETVK